MSKPVLGLIGGIGSGKSAVAHQLAQRGALVIHADRLGHEALEQPDIRDRALARWGPGILGTDDRISRPSVAAIVFRDQAERRALEEMVFPHIERRCREEIDRGRADPNVVLIVLDAAILLEAGWDRVCDRILYVHAPREVRLQRLREGRGWSDQELELREQAQLPLEEKARRAHGRIDNSGSLEELTCQVDELLAELLGVTSG